MSWPRPQMPVQNFIVKVLNRRHDRCPILGNDRWSCTRALIRQPAPSAQVHDDKRKQRGEGKRRHKIGGRGAVKKKCRENRRRSEMYQRNPNGQSQRRATPGEHSPVAMTSSRNCLIDICLDLGQHFGCGTSGQEGVLGKPNFLPRRQNFRTQTVSQ